MLEHAPHLRGAHHYGNLLQPVRRPLAAPSPSSLALVTTPLLNARGGGRRKELMLNEVSPSSHTHTAHVQC